MGNRCRQCGVVINDLRLCQHCLRLPTAKMFTLNRIAIRASMKRIAVEVMALTGGLWGEDATISQYLHLMTIRKSVRGDHKCDVLIQARDVMQDYLKELRDNG